MILFASDLSEPLVSGEKIAIIETQIHNFGPHRIHTFMVTDFTSRV